MKQKPEVRMQDDAADEGKWVRRSLSRARVQLGQAVADVLTTGAGGKPGDAAYGRMRELLQRDRATLAHPAHAGHAAASPVAKPAVKSPPPPPPKRAATSAGGTAQYQASAPVQTPAAQTGSAAPYLPSTPAHYAAPSAPPRPPASATVATGQYQPYQTVATMAPMSTPAPAPMPTPAPVVVSKPAAAPAPRVQAAASAASSASSEDGGDPIRTLTMARLLAVQGYRKRALSIYDELLARDPHDPALRAEADRLRT